MTSPTIAVQAYEARALRVHFGVNRGDALGPAESCEAGDVYRLAGDAEALKLRLVPDAGGGRLHRLAPGSSFGAANETVELVCRHTVMAADGATAELLYLHHPASGTGLIVPLSPLAPRGDYTLITSNDAPADMPPASVLLAAFAGGTLISLPGGAQVPIERLRDGDLVLTRDHGPQEIRWIGKATLRAQGAFAPVVIAAGRLGNSADLVVSPHHRIFLYQRGARLPGVAAELLVQARHLVDDSTVTRREGGFVDYYGLVFDRHEIVYAEGIPAESLMVNEATLRRMPPELAEEIAARFPGLSQSQHFGTEAGREMLDDAARKQLPGR
ncbi:MAG: Hint domain-containing protein [Defluviimonas sp.]|nr:Hint domain-containing protein [Paracoccaceae bacterium]MCC0064804.1 Hint domain-containing protein [Defluviimonas sp.]